jgi:uncharacterized membrane protein
LYVAVPSALASAVEFVEAFTIVLAVGVTRNWRSALAGTAVALVVLAAIVLVLGVAVLRLVPIDLLRGLVGVFLLLFGLKWLRKAILRYSGYKALHDEAETFREEVEVLRSRAATDPRSIDPFAATTSFNGVLLEGLEVVFIVIGLGSAARAMGPAVGGAVVAGLVVVAAGYALRHPLERVPENTMKFVVGVMLTTFGTFWTGEALGVPWWRSDLSLLPLLAGYLLVSWVFVTALRRTREREGGVTSRPARVEA